MKRSMELSSLSEYIAYIPVYENGNSVLAVNKDGQTAVISMGIKSVIDRLLKERSIDLKVLRRNLSGSIGRVNLLPVPLGIERVLIPVKVRKTIGINDGAYTYIDLSHIQEVAGSDKAQVKLRCGYEIQCLETSRSVKNRMKTGNMVMERFASTMMRQLNMAEGAMAVSAEYSQPATKGDITILAYEIMKLRKIFER